MASSNTSAKSGVKRKLEFQGNQDSPKKIEQVQRDDGHYSTPVKMRLQYDHWSVKATKLEITDLQMTEYVNEPLRFRVILKKPLKPTRQGSLLFSFHGMDGSGVISFIAFGDEADQFSKVIELNNIYTIDCFKVKEESPNYPSGSGNNVQIHLSRSSVLTQKEEDEEIPPMPFEATSLTKIYDMSAKDNVDVLAVIVKDWGVEKTSTGIIKRDLSLSDETKTTVLLTLWREQASDFGNHVNSVVAIRRAVVSEFRGDKSLNLTAATMLWVNPKVPGAESLNSWYEEQMENMKKSKTA